MEKKYDAVYNVARINNRMIYDLFMEYFDNHLLYSVEEVEIERIFPTSLYIQSKRLEYAEFTANVLKWNGLDLFEPHIKQDSTGIKRFVPPPIVEMRGDLCVLCDGTHRVYTAKQMGMKKIVVLAVRGTYKPLAGDITSWDRLRINDSNYRSSENFVNYNDKGMTGYSKFCKSNYMIVQEVKDYEK